MIIKGKNVAYKLQGKIYHCAMDITMDYIGGKWKTVVLWYLKNGTHRFAELKRLIPDITEKMLSIQLRNLEKDGLIKRKVGRNRLFAWNTPSPTLALPSSLL